MVAARSLLNYARYHLHELAALAAVLLIHYLACRRLLATDLVRRHRALRFAIPVLTVSLSLWAIFGVITAFPEGYEWIPSSSALFWVRGAAIGWCFATLGAGIIYWIAGRIPRFSPARRGFLKTAGAAMSAVPFAALGFGILIQRGDFRVTEVDVPIPNLPESLRGLRLVQLSDIHLSPFLSERELARVVDMANETRAHVALVTGDLITSEGDPLDACVRQLARLKADAGVLGCLGNHEIYARCENEAAAMAARAGIGFLRQQNRSLRFGDATLNIAGVDYQRSSARHIARAGSLVAPGAVNILLSHNPNAFDEASRIGFDLVVAGHTHGGQVTVEILHQTLNMARFFTEYVYGLYRKDGRAVWVTRGIGTVGVPARLGAPPEIALLRLCDT